MGGTDILLESDPSDMSYTEHIAYWSILCAIGLLGAFIIAIPLEGTFVSVVGAYLGPYLVTAFRPFLEVIWFILVMSGIALFINSVDWWLLQADVL